MNKADVDNDKSITATDALLILQYSVDKISKFKALDIEVKDEVIVKRMSGRRFCPTCQKTYHVVSLPPKEEGICDQCKVPLSIREDDKAETVLHRLEVYHEQTEPLVRYYKDRLVTVDGTRSLEEITE
ncbi:MAG: nucleoside monophosphate kinase, partial [Clostridia bacterium]|nr:nucleoside monophosphate kinase [Clostridia bacterium]